MARRRKEPMHGYYLTWSWPKWGNRWLTDSYKRPIRILCCLNPSNDKAIKRQGQGGAPEGTGDGKSYEKSKVWKKQCKNGYHFFSLVPHPGEGPSVTSLRGSPSRFDSANHAEEHIIGPLKKNLVGRKGESLAWRWQGQGIGLVYFGEKKFTWGKKPSPPPPPPPKGV